MFSQREILWPFVILHMFCYCKYGFIVTAQKVHSPRSEVWVSQGLAVYMDKSVQESHHETDNASRVERDVSKS